MGPGWCAVCDISQLIVSYSHVYFFRPASPQELFNLRHAQARNAIERIFGVLKRRFRILVIPCKFKMSIQARIPPALCALHNFIRMHDSAEIGEFPPDLVDPSPGEWNGSLGHGSASRAELHRAQALRDQIAQEMWEEYQQVLEERGEL